MPFLPLILLAIGLGQAATGDIAITGHITDAITHQPIYGVKITYCCTPASGETDASGSFLLHVEPAFAESRFTITKDGYVTLQERVPGDPHDRDFELMPSAHLSGRLVDWNSGEPLEGFRVVSMSQGRPPAMFVARPSGKDGSFVILGQMKPGNYILQASPAKEYRFTEGRVKESEDASPCYGATYFPGVPSADAAVPVAIAPGEDRHIEIRLVERKCFYVAGTIELPEGHETDRLNIRLVRDGGAIGEETFKRGPFHIDGLAPGSYVLSFFARTGVAVTQPVEVTNRNIDNLQITLRLAAAIRATVTLLEDKAAPPQHATFRILPARLNDKPADPSDSLYIRDLPPGQYWPLLSLPGGYAVTAVTYGGRPVYNEPISIEAEESVVNFVVTSRTAAVSGVVRDANQTPVPHALVTISPDPAPVRIDGSSPTSTRDYVTERFRTNSDATGAFRIADLAPGNYIVVAGNGEGRKVDLDFGQAASVDLQMK